MKKIWVLFLVLFFLAPLTAFGQPAQNVQGINQGLEAVQAQRYGLNLKPFVLGVDFFFGYCIIKML